MRREQKMLKNTAIYFLGNFASKFLTFFLLPLYTTYLSPAEYGYTDNLLNLLSLLGPILSLQAGESVFRYLQTAKTSEEQEKTISNSLLILLIGFALFVMIYIPIYKRLNIFYGIAFLFYCLSSYFSIFLQQILRGFNLHTIYAFTGIVSSVVQLAVNFYLIAGLNKKGNALLIAGIVGTVATSILAIISTKIWRYVRITAINKDVIKKHIKYGLPLIPSNVCWWWIGIFGRYVLQWNHSLEATGIYAVVAKFPNILNVFTGIFSLSWYESAIQEYHSIDRDEYYNRTFNSFVNLLLIGYTVILPVIRLYFLLAIDSTYFTSQRYVPLFLLGAIFNCIASFLSAFYRASLKTSGDFYTTFIAAVLNVVLSMILIPLYGIWGVAISMFFSFVVLYLVRIYSINKLVSVKANMHDQSIYILFACVSTFFYFQTSVFLHVLFTVIYVSGIVFSFRKQLLDILLNIKNKFL